MQLVEQIQLLVVVNCLHCFGNWQTQELNTWAFNNFAHVFEAKQNIGTTEIVCERERQPQQQKQQGHQQQQQQPIDQWRSLAIIEKEFRQTSNY